MSYIGFVTMSLFSIVPLQALPASSDSCFMVKVLNPYYKAETSEDLEDVNYIFGGKDMSLIPTTKYTFYVVHNGNEKKSVRQLLRSKRVIGYRSISEREYSTHWRQAMC